MGKAYMDRKRWYRVNDNSIRQNVAMNGSAKKADPAMNADCVRHDRIIRPFFRLLFGLSPQDSPRTLCHER